MRVPPHDHRRRTTALLLFAAALAGCGGDGTTGPIPAGSVAISPPAFSSMYLGQQQPVVARVLDDQRNTLSGRTITWVSSDPTVIKVASATLYGTDALLTAMSVGSVTLTASSGEKSSSVTIVVHPPGPVATVEAPQTLSIEYPFDGQLTVVLRDRDHVVLIGRSVSYATADPAIATVSATGLVSTVAVGQTTITATSEGKSGPTQLTVVAPRLTHAFLWTAAGGMQDLGALPGFPHSSATAINNSGVVVGYTWNLTLTGWHAFQWTAAGGLVDLGTLPGGSSSFATAVNAIGTVVGWASTSAGDIHAVLWSASGAIQDLGTLPFDVRSSASAIDDAGRVVGVSRSSASARAFRWTAADGMTAIPGLLAGYSDALGTNRKGDIIVGGDSRVVGGDFVNMRPYLWTATAGMHELPLLANDAQGTAVAVNDGGDVLGISGFDCGYYCYGASANRVVLWPGGGDAVDLTGSLGSGASAAAINATGQIAGMTARGRAFLRDAAGVHELGVLPNKSLSTALGLNDAGQVVGRSQ